MNRFIEQLALARLDGTYIKWLNQIAKATLLILDDFGLQPLSHDTKMALFQILEDRYASGSTIITAQMPVGNWHEYINDPSLADAINRSHSTGSCSLSINTMAMSLLTRCRNC